MLDTSTPQIRAALPLLYIAWAKAERVILDRFVEAIQDVEDSDLREALTTLRSLFALSRLENDLDWFLEAGYVTGTKAKAIRGEVNDVCDDVRPSAEALVDAFGIPDSPPRAPIATKQTAQAPADLGRNPV